MWLTTLWEQGLCPVPWMVVVAASLAAAISDIATRRIPNLLTGPLLLGGLVWAVWTAGPAGLADSISACVLLALPYVLLFLFAGGGAGDAKLMGAVGAWLGMINGLIVLSCVCASAVILGVVCAAGKKRIGKVLRNLQLIVCHAVFYAASRGRFREVREVLPATEDMQKMPYGVSIFIGVCLAAGGVVLWRK